MVEPEKKEENIEIRTMKSDYEEFKSPHPKKEVAMPVAPTEAVLKESEYMAPQVQKTSPSTPVVPPKIAPLKIIPPKKFPDVPVKPLFKAAPVWLKIGAIGLGSVLIIFSGLYGYWKFFIQDRKTEPPAATQPTTPSLPKTPQTTAETPIKFFNKLPHKTVTLDLPSKTRASLLSALKSEATVEETIASIKQIKITFEGKPLAAAEFLDLMSVFTPQDFLTNYENDFAFAFFRQKEGARPILILKTKNKDLSQSQMKTWETAKLPSDIFPLFLSNSKPPQIFPEFKSYLFIGQSVRYLNVGISYASLNYAVYNDFLIFTTSSAGMFVVLQDMTGQTASLDYLKSLEASIDKFVK